MRTLHKRVGSHRRQAVRRQWLPHLPVLPAVGPRLGPRQLRVLEIGGLDSELGLTATDVAHAAALTAPNATVALKRLAELGYLAQIVDQRPARWRRT